MTVEELQSIVRWSIKDSEQLYHINGWGEPYFKINDRGQIEVDPSGKGKHKVDLFDLVADIQERGHNLPLLLLGQGGHTVNTGRHVRFDNVPVNNLWLSMLDRAGANLERLGDSTGRIALA